MTTVIQAVRYPHVKVKLVGKDGNAYCILGAVSSALKKGGATREQVKEVYAAATSGDYDNLLRTCMEWVEVR